MTVSYALRLVAAALLCSWALQANAAITCTLTATSVNLNYVNGQGSDATASGTITVNCTRLSTDPNTQTYWVGVNRGSAGALRVFRHGGGATSPDRLNVSVLRNSDGNNWTTVGSGRANGTLSFGGALSASAPLTYDFLVAAGQSSKTAGIYDEIFTANLQLTTAGANVATAIFAPTVSITAACFVGQVASGNTAPGAISPSTLTLAYTSFAPTNQTATMNFTVDCTRNTTYTLALSLTSGTLLGLNYTLALSPSGGPPAIVGSGLAQPYTVTGTIAAGQAGTCATGTCTATKTGVTLTVTY
ncbi:spore coat protein U domain-containing protein [Polaromonas jejuensis]|uniref:Spore coat protein U domain-containing protein n=1 Tax=Polaromonas jejuensis TaxID=457502 RepID=A0ABW0Q7C9_9BURK|nr:spore coat protein U domain-containing protein [Polaromonas jejuensis]